MDIVDQLFCPKITEDDATYVAWLTSDHHQKIYKLYPEESVIPKMHFMVHMPRLMIQFGPLVRHWTMRYEAKHSYFKQLAQSMGNFINLPYSLAMRHQQLQCYGSMNDWEMPGAGLNVGPGYVIIPDKLQEKLQFPVTSAYEARWVNVDGVEYKKDVGIIYDMTADLPKVGQVTSVFVIIINNNKVVFEVNCFSSMYIC